MNTLLEHFLWSEQCFWTQDHAEYLDKLRFHLPTQRTMLVLAITARKSK